MIRKIHLDFHTPPYVPDVACDSDPAAFAGTLADARVTDIVIFAKDQYGLTYFPTRAGTRHPNLRRPNLLGDLVQACASRGIRVQAYFTLGLDPQAAIRHPEWRQRLPDGEFSSWGPAVPHMEFASPYIEEMVMPQLDEAMEAAPGVAGFWFDICLYFGAAYYSAFFDQYAAAHARVDADLQTRSRLAYRILRETADKLNRHIARRMPGAQNYYNTLVTAGGGERAAFESATEVEAPPFFVNNDTMAVTLRYLRTLPVPVIGLTSRFQYPWTDIGALRTHDQILFDAASVIAAGGHISIGDHGHPHGRLEPLVYERIGAIYRYFEQMESWIDGTRPVAEAAVITNWDVKPENSIGEVPPAARCALRMLGEIGIQADLVGLDADLGRYRLVVWPGDQPADAALAARLRAFVQAGGRLLATGLAWRGLEDLFGIASVQPGQIPVKNAHWGDYVRPTAALPGLDPWRQVSYERLWIVTAASPTVALAERVLPVVTGRAPDHLGSTPPAPGTDADGGVIVRRGGAIYSGLPFFASFQAHGNAVFRDYAAALLDLLLPDRLIRHDGGPNVEVALHAGAAGRVVHLVQWASERWPTRHMYPARAPRLAPVTVEVRGAQPRAVRSLPDNMALAFAHEDGGTRFATPSFTVHQAIAME